MTDHLSPYETQAISTALQSRREHLRWEVRAQLEGSEDDRIVGLRRRLSENDDWGVADGLAELDIAEVRHALAELAEVEAALGRLASGGYGSCVECGEPIAAARLVAYPTAARCIECQQRYEVRRRGPAATAR